MYKKVCKLVMNGINENQLVVKSAINWKMLVFKTIAA